MKTRKIVCANGSYRVTIPKHLIESMGWAEHDELEFQRKGGKLIVSKGCE